MKTKKINIHELTHSITLRHHRNTAVFWTTNDGDIWQKSELGLLPIGAKYILQDDLNDEVRTDTDRLQFLSDYGLDLRICQSTKFCQIEKGNGFAPFVTFEQGLTVREAIDYLMDQEELNG